MNLSPELASPLWAAGYASLPCPRSVNLEGGDIVIDSGWTLSAPGEVDGGAVETLISCLRRRLGEPPAAIGEPGVHSILLSVQPGAVATGAAAGISAQAYRLEILSDRIRITGNADAGLYYGVQTLVQILRRAPGGGGLEAPLATIEDWPDRELRVIHYDTKHHQDRLETVKLLIARAAGFKINAIAWEIDDRFAYRRHPAIGAPGAFTADQMRQIVVHAQRHHVEVIPIVQGPSHLAFILKHEEFAHLREDRANNYMLCPSNPQCYELLFSMYDELIAATPGCRYFFVGTDEPYFLGDGTACGCRARREAIGQGGMMAEFIARCADYLFEKGRTVMCWGEWPMRAEDVSRLPSGIVNGVYQNDEMSAAYARSGIRELIYCPIQGSRPLFPDYFYAAGADGSGQPRIDLLSRRVRRGAVRRFDPLGTFIAAWDDSGLHLECFWMGWAIGSAWGWNPETPDEHEAVAQFCRVFHGPETTRMPRVYRALDRLAGFWSRAWDQAPSKRGPSYQRGWHPRYDRTLTLPNLPDAETLDNRPFFCSAYSELLAEAAASKELLAEALDTIGENSGRARRNRYSLEVMRSVAALIADFILMLETLAELEALLGRAREDAGKVRFARAAAGLDSAVALARSYVSDRQAMMTGLTATWEKSRLPKGQAVSGREFLHIQDDTKDHAADRTADLGYLIKPSRDLNIESWADSLEEIAAEFRRRHPDTGREWQPAGDFTEPD